MIQMVFFLTRRRLVHTLRNQDGGSHLDSTITDPAYVRVAKGNEFSWNFSTPSGGGVLKGSHLATMRQIAWEIQSTLTNNPLIQ